MGQKTDWLRIGQTLSLGESVRIPCCKTDNSAVLSRNKWGLSFSCFRCGRKEGKRLQFSLKELFSPDKSKEFMQGDRLLPPDFEQGVSEDKLAWTLKYGITLNEIKEYEIGFSKSLDRVIIPIFSDSGIQREVVGSVARRCNPSNPIKYLNKFGKVGVLFKSKPKHTIPSLCITEDILSSIKVGRYIESVALLGTSVPDARLASLIRIIQDKEKREGCPPIIFIWLDSDEAGCKGSLVLSKALKKTLANRVCIVKSRDDPKCYSTLEIQNKLLDLHRKALLYDRLNTVETV